MLLQEYLHNHPERGEFTQISRFPAAVPAMPQCINQRRQDVFICYRALVEANRDIAPVSAYTARVRNATLITGERGRRASLLASGEGTAFPELFAQSATALPLLAKPPSPVPRLGGVTAVVTEISAGENYYHWMLTALPKLLLLMYRYGRLKFDRLLVNDATAPFVRQSLEMLGVPPEMVVSASDFPHVVLEDACVGVLSSELLYPHQLVAEVFRSVFPRALYRGKRLYILRRGSRVVTNDSELLAILKPMGFEAVALEALTVAEQVRIFAQAECIISPHGAGLSNLVFAPVRTKVLEFFSPQQVSSTYWFLANACSQEYHYLLGTGEDLPFQTDNWRSAERPDIHVNPDDFAKAVAALKL